MEITNKIDWKAYQKEVENSIANERLWMMGASEEEIEGHQVNIETLTEELENIINGDYAAVINRYIELVGGEKQLEKLFDNFLVDNDNQVEHNTFTYAEHEFMPVRQFTEEEDLKVIGNNMGSIITFEGWNYEDFYLKAKEIGAGEIDVFNMDGKYDIIPAERGISIYGQKSNELYSEKIINDKITDWEENYNKWGLIPDLADVEVMFRDGEPFHCLIALNEKTGKLMDDKVFFTCSSLDEFKNLTRNNNGEDFKILNFYGFADSEKTKEQRKQELLYESIADVAINIGKLLQKNQTHDFVQNIDTKALTVEVVKWAKEFEKLHQKTDWREQDYFTEIDKFSNQKWQSYTGIKGETQSYETYFQQQPYWLKIFTEEQTKNELKVAWEEGAAKIDENWDRNYQKIMDGAVKKYGFESVRQLENYLKGENIPHKTNHNQLPEIISTINNELKPYLQERDEAIKKHNEEILKIKVSFMQKFHEFVKEKVTKIGFIASNDNIKLRCKIDGVQQMGKAITELKTIPKRYSIGEIRNLCEKYFKEEIASAMNNNKLSKGINR